MNPGLKKGVTRLLHRASRAVGARYDGLLILTYHRISEGVDAGDPLQVSAAAFARQMESVARRQRVISAEELLACLSGRQTVPDRACLITFDDGWADNYSLALPVLRRHGLPALIFLSTDFIGTTRSFWHETLRAYVDADLSGRAGLAETVIARQVGEELERLRRLPRQQRSDGLQDLVRRLKSRPPRELEKIARAVEAAMGDAASRGARPDMLSWEQVHEMRAHGLAFGSHGTSHTILTRLDTGPLRAELEASKLVLERELGAPVELLAYPNGDFNRHVVETAIAAGYRAGFTCRPGRNADLRRPMELRRFTVREDSAHDAGGRFSEEHFEAELSGLRQHLRALLPGART